MRQNMVLVQCCLKRRDPSCISFSKVLGPRGGGLSTYEKELKAILLAVDRWRHYLPFKYNPPPKFEFSARTKANPSFTIESSSQTQWSFIHHRVQEGTYNRVADALSRRMIRSGICWNY
jgi:hypothetical protein